MILFPRTGSGSVRFWTGVCAGRSLSPLVKTRAFGMTPVGAQWVEDFQIEPLPPHKFIFFPQTLALECFCT
jgi:hypothetical protein